MAYTKRIVVPNPANKLLRGSLSDRRVTRPEPKVNFIERDICPAWLPIVSNQLTRAQRARFVGL